METEELGQKSKRLKSSNEQLELVVHGADDAALVKSREEEIDEIGVGSEETSAEIARIYEQIQSFTNMVCDLLESGKSMLKDLSNEFEERMISIHKEHIQKWEEEIQTIRLVDASNAQESAVLQNAKAMLQNVCGES
ncbi:OLC1v1020794C1 [Oldenlandia corymbosa var. corymbosa]|uniref:OLC1v1020794C1 n=1 Tax=Oldenlandia corymbosa var. corymbosa TaxID=529605 RepID=A0AAV1BUW7_OLDCO|nr:OLC1v1020794C1 [Oldenlandia corymbosa var. corymbosa]